MTADFGVLVQLRRMLSDNDLMKEHGVEDHIHLGYPAVNRFPMISLEVEEIWTTSFPQSPGSARALLKVRATTMSNTASGQQSLAIAQAVRTLIDGRVFTVEEGQKAMSRLQNSVIDMPQPNKPRGVHQYYDIIVRM